MTVLYKKNFTRVNMSVLRSVKDILPKLMKRISSIVKDAIVIDTNGDEKVLRDSKDITKERKNVKDTLYNVIDLSHSNLSKDVHTINSRKITISIKPEEFEALMDKFYADLKPFSETFVVEKKMGPTIAKYGTILFAGLLIEHSNNSKN